MKEPDWATIRELALGQFALASLPPSIELPALPHAVTLFIEKSNQPNADLRQLAQVVETDTGLTLELLRHVNSTFVGVRQKTQSVQQALALLGLRQSRTLLMTAGMAAAVRARKSKLLNQNCFWNFSLQKALFAREVATLLQADPDVAFAGAVLQDYLLPVITNDLYDEYLQFSEARDSQQESLCDYEDQVFGWNHAVAGASLAHRWKLPDELVCCILFHHTGLRILAHPDLKRTPAAAVALSALLPDQLRQQNNGLPLLIGLSEKWPAFELPRLIERVDEVQREIGLGVSNDFPLARRCRVVFERQNAVCAG